MKIVKVQKIKSLLALKANFQLKKPLITRALKTLKGYFYKFRLFVHVEFQQVFC